MHAHVEIFVTFGGQSESRIHASRIHASLIMDTCIMDTSAWVTRPSWIHTWWIRQSESWIHASRIHASWTHLRGSPGLSARRAWRTESGRSEGLQEPQARSEALEGPQTSSINIFIILTLEWCLPFVGQWGFSSNINRRRPTLSKKWAPVAFRWKVQL